MAAVRVLAESQGPQPDLKSQVISPDVILQFERADKWLKPMRP